MNTHKLSLLTILLVWCRLHDHWSSKWGLFGFHYAADRNHIAHTAGDLQAALSAKSWPQKWTFTNMAIMFTISKLPYCVTPEILVNQQKRTNFPTSFQRVEFQIINSSTWKMINFWVKEFNFITFYQSGRHTVF